MIASVSGVRGVPNGDVLMADFARLATSFARTTGAGEFLVARDTRTTGEAIRMAVVGALLSAGADVTDCGVISTPALFRESLLTKRPGIMVTASHNEPEFNGMKFVKDGFGASEQVMRAVVSSAPEDRKQACRAARVRRRNRVSYNDDLVRRFGTGALEGARVALDLGGGAAIVHAVPVLRKLGCTVFPINDTPGIFSRAVDPTKDELTVLSRITKEEKCDIGLAFDCDGDRLVIVDSNGKKRTGDHMLTLAISRELRESARRDVVVSVDTTSAIDELVEAAGGRVYRSRVGEANVVAMMLEKRAGVGGEGSSGGLIDGSFNYCRDSMLACLLIIGGLKEGGQKFYDSVKSYHQARAVLPMPRRQSAKAMTRLAGRHRDSDTTDGVKLTLSRRSWVLVRPSNTEEVVRVSAEAESPQEAGRIVARFSEELRELGR